MKQTNNRRLSKFLSLILRHRPEKIGLTLDAQGWAAVDELVEKMNQSGNTITKSLLFSIVENNDKQRYALNESKDKIRANQGHSIEIDLGYSPAIPPPVLYHGTSERYIDSILKTGLTKQSRHHVHLSTNTKTASQVGLRHGKLVLLAVDAQKMQEAGFTFFVSDNQVWLTDHVPVEFISRI